MSEYPEHAKLHAVAEQSQAIGEFLERGRYELCELVDSGKVVGLPPEPVMEYQPVASIQDALAGWFGIDLKALEREKRAMLDAYREATS